MKHITNKDFGTSKAIHSIIDKDIKTSLDNKLGDYVDSTDQSHVPIKDKRSKRWIECAKKIKKYLHPLIDVNSFDFCYPTNGIHESIDHFAIKVKQYQIFEGEYRYPTILNKPINVATSVNSLLPGVPLYMSNPFSATGNFDPRYDEVGSRDLCPIYLDLAFGGTTGENKIKMYDCVEQVFWSCSKAYGVNLLRAGVRFSKKEELLQREIQGAGYFNSTIIDVFDTVISHSTVFEKKQKYQNLQKQICEQFDLVPSDSFLVGTTNDTAWDRFKRENGINRVCLTPIYKTLL